MSNIISEQGRSYKNETWIFVRFVYMFYIYSSIDIYLLRPVQFKNTRTFIIAYIHRIFNRDQYHFVLPWNPCVVVEDVEKAR